MTDKKHKARDGLRRLNPKREHIRGWPREHYNLDHSPKMQYKTEESATKVAKMMEYRTGTTGMTAYLCPYCGCWHIGHQVPYEKDYRPYRLRATLNNELIMLNHYRTNLEHVANEVQAISTKIDKLENLIQEHYRELKDIYTDEDTVSKDLRS